MITRYRRSATALALALGAALALSACTTSSDETTSEGESSETSESRFPLTVTDMAGNEVTIESLDSVVITDNRLFQLAAEWDIELSAAPRALMSPNNPLKEDEAILDLGTHSAPDFEQIIAADPTVIINGYRYRSHAEELQKQAPDAAFIAMDLAEGDDTGTDEYLVESITLMGEIFDKEAEAAALLEEFHGAVDDALAAYDASTTVMGLVTTGKDINYSNPTDGRGASIFFDLLDLTPALDADGSTNHQGDDVSLETLAAANADVFLVLDRAAAVSSEGENIAALELINSSGALSTVNAVVNEAIYVMPGDYYLTEDAYAYITVLEGLTKVFEQL